MKFINHNKWFQKPLYISTFLLGLPFLVYYKKQLYTFLKSLIYKDQAKKINILTQQDEYIEKNTDLFLKKLNEQDINNKNVEVEFYNEESYKKTVNDENNHLESKWKKRLLFEQTPRGYVIMYYDAFKMGFSYYSDTNSLPHKLLNAVAMKYCLTFCCFDFFIDQNIVPKEYESPLVKIHHIEKKKKKNTELKKGVEETDNDSPFAKLKNYNKNKLNTSDSSDKKDKQEQTIKNIITNKFISLGKTRTFDPLFKPIKKNRSVHFTSDLLDNLNQETNLQKQVLSYKDYKNGSL